MSEKMAEQIDDAINNLIFRLNQKARELLEENKDKLKALAESLIEHEVLDREEIDRVMKGEVLESTKKSRQYQSLSEKMERRKKENTPPPDPGDSEEESLKQETPPKDESENDPKNV
jgi:cell division protease FtsH